MSEELIGGYLVTYYKRDFTSSLRDRITVICSPDRLIYLLNNSFSYFVSTSQYINVQEYLRNHDDQPEIWL